MSTDELEKLFAEHKLVKAEFNGEFEFWFDNGISVTVGTTTEWDCAVWEIESSLEAEARNKKWEEDNKRKNEAKERWRNETERIKEKYGVDAYNEYLKLFENAR